MTGLESRGGDTSTDGGLFGRRPTCAVESVARGIAQDVGILGFRLGWAWSDRAQKFPHPAGQGGRAKGTGIPRKPGEVDRMDYAIRLEHVSSRPLAVVRRRAASRELSVVVPDACGIVWRVVRAQQVPGLGRHVAVYLDHSINLEVGVELTAPFGGHGEVTGSATPSGPVAATTHYGPYGLLNKAHEAIRRWCENHGHVLAGPNWEIYGHWQDDWNSDPTRITTDVYYLLVVGGNSAA